MVQTTPPAAGQQPPGGEASPPPRSSDGFVRLPVESAKKLRWYDQHDVKMLIQLHLREKHELHQANTLLRDALKQLGGASRPEVAAVNAAVDRLKSEDAAVNDMLVLAAQAEVERLQDQVGTLSSELKAAHTQNQHQSDEAAATLAAAPNNSNSSVRMDDDGNGADEHGGESTNTAAQTCAQCSALQQQASRLSSALADASSAKDVAEEQLTKAKEKFVEMQQAQTELVKLAQDERLEAESRREHAETKVDQLNVELKRLKEKESKGRSTEVEVATAALAHQLASCQTQVTSLEHRLAYAESENARLSADARDLEAAAAESDALYHRLAAAEARLEESRAGHLSSTSLREMLQQSEVRRLSAEEELVATAKLAAELEEKLARVTVGAEGAQVEAQQAGMKAAAAWEAIEAAVEQRWSAAGGERDRWPARAQEEMESVEARLAAVMAANKSSQEELGAALRAQRVAEDRAVAAQQKAASIEASMERLSRSAEQRDRRLEAATLAATRQVDEFRAALGVLERERNQLLEEKKSSATVAGARFKAGSGSLVTDIDSSSLDGDDFLKSTELMYLRNVLLKFLGAHLEGRQQECDVLLPALAAVLRASPAEFKKLKEMHARAHSVLPSFFTSPSAMPSILVSSSS